MRAARTLLVALVLLALPLAGCFGAAEVPTERRVSASGGKASPGWAYDGAGYTDAQATLEGRLDDAGNVGAVNVTFTYAGASYVATFDRFAESKPFMDGGVAFELDEHGDSGAGDASIPKIRANVAAWGLAKVTRGGEVLAGKAGDAWSAHLMVSADTVRGADGKILNAAGNAPYDPAKPTDAKTTPGDAQAFFFIKHPDGETAARAPLPITGSADFAGPETTQTLAIPAEKGALSLTLTVNSTSGSTPVALGELSLRVLDAAGNETATGTAQVLPNQPASLALSVEGSAISGPLTLEMTGTGIFHVDVTGALLYDDHPFLVLTWDEVTLS